MTAHRIVIATPHARYDALERALRRRGIDVLRVREREALTPEALATFAPRLVFFPHWSWKIAPVVYERFECVVFHMADVPFGRGGSPLQNLIDRGLQQTQLSALRCGAELDAGPVYLKRPLSLLGSAEEILLRAAALMEDMVATLLEAPLHPHPQQGEVVIFKRRTPAQSDLAGATTLERVHDMIRMLDADGYPHAFVEAHGLRFEFTRASRAPGHVQADVRITLVERAGNDA